MYIPIPLNKLLHTGIIIVDHHNMCGYIYIQLHRLIGRFTIFYHHMFTCSHVNKHIIYIPTLYIN